MGMENLEDFCLLSACTADGPRTRPYGTTVKPQHTVHPSLIRRGRKGTEGTGNEAGIVLIIVAAVALMSAAAVALNDSADNSDENSGLPAYTVSGSADFDGNIYVSFVYSKNIMMLDSQGNVVWYKHEDTGDTPAGFWDFKKHVVGGVTYYSYHDQDVICDKFGLPGFAPGDRVILDENFNEVKRIRFETSPRGIVEQGHPLDGHDFLLIDLDHYIMSGYLKEEVHNIPSDLCHIDDPKVIYSYLQEVDHGEVVWEWRSIDYPDTYRMTQTDATANANDFDNLTTDAPDYVHFNAMRLDENGRLICSFRHLDSVLCLDRTNNTPSGQILWRLSGTAEPNSIPRFDMDDGLITSGQHYVTVEGPGIVRVFNNNNAGEHTCVRIFTLDEGNMTAAAQDLTVPGRFSSACGSVEHIAGDIYAIGWGKAENDTKCMSVYDFSTGTELMYMELENGNNFTYRCAYYP